MVLEQFSNTLLYVRLRLALQHLSDLTVQRHGSVHYLGVEFAHFEADVHPERQPSRTDHSMTMGETKDRSSASRSLREMLERSFLGPP